MIRKPKRTLPLAERRDELQGRISSGEELLADMKRNPFTQTAYASSWEHTRDNWHNTNTMVLQQIFDQPDVAIDYRHATPVTGGTSWSGKIPLHKHVDNMREFMRTMIAKLRSIQSELDQYGGPDDGIQQPAVLDGGTPRRQRERKVLSPPNSESPQLIVALQEAIVTVGEHLQAGEDILRKATNALSAPESNITGIREEYQQWYSRVSNALGRMFDHMVVVERFHGDQGVKLAAWVGEPADAAKIQAALDMHLDVLRRIKTELGEAATITSDSPEMTRRFLEWTMTADFTDDEFGKKVGALLKGNHLNAAVREAFVLLKERMVRTYGLDSNLDGKVLVNKVFGKDGVKTGPMPDDQRESLRNLLDGLYGVFRNKYIHNDVAAERYEVAAILLSVNWALKEIDRLK